MVNTIITSFDVWTTAQTIKSNGRSVSVDNQKQYGIDKLRELILELAVSGKLVPQDPNDEPASELLKKIINEKERLIREGKIKKQESSPKIGEDEKPFEVPNGWSFIRLLDLTKLITKGSSPKWQGIAYTEDCEEVLFVTSENVGSYELIFENKKYVERKFNEIEPRSILEKGDYLMNIVGGSIGRTAIYNIDDLANINQAVCLIRVFSEYLDKQYLLHFFNSNLCVSYMFEKQVDNARANLSMGNISKFIVPLPPLAEQHRIVAKVDELMALCDQLEQQQTNSNAAHHTLVETLLGTLTNAAGQTEFEASWQRIATHFDTLFTTEYSIDQLKQTILQLAVMGKLVPQDPNDEQASELLKKIWKEKERLVKEGKIRKQEKLEDIGKEYKTIEIPVNWSLTRLGNLIYLVSGQHLKPEEYADSMQIGMVPYLTGPAEFGDQFPSPTRYTSERRALALKGDILITCKGSGVGKLNIADTETAISRQLMAIRPVDSNPQYLKLLAESLNESIREKIVGIAIPGISREDITESIVKLPPLAEQHRIVAKVNELFAICDSLKERIKDAQHIQVQLAEAVVEGVLG